jgi:hypothetical protein
VPFDAFISRVSGNGNFAGVFEGDGQTSLFYLCDANEPQNPKILDAIRICSGAPAFAESDIEIRWDAGDRKVGLFVRGVLWAVFDRVQKTKHGGNYHPERLPDIPSDAGF